MQTTTPMLRSAPFWSLLALLSLGTLSLAQARPYTPSPGTAERAGIANGLRVPVQRELEQPVIFKFNTLKVENGWAFANAEPLKPNGRELTYWGKDQQAAGDEASWGGTIQALLRKRNGRWRVVTYVIGVSDVEWFDWDKRYGAPTAILH